MYLLPPNPGPLGTLEQWGAWRDELLALGATTPGVDVELAVAELAIKDLKENVQPGALGTEAFECMKDADSKSRHVTRADGNVFVDLGFSPLEAAALLVDADARIAAEKGK